MSNIANPGCCCDLIAPYYPWLCYETRTQAGGSLGESGQIVRVPLVTVSYQGYGSGDVPTYDPMSSYILGDKVYITSEKKVYTATGVVGLSGMPAGPFNSNVWGDGIAVPDTDVDKHCVDNGVAVTSTAEKHYVKFDVFNSSGSPIDEVANMSLRTPGVSYAWHIVQDMRTVNNFSDSASYASGDLISLDSPISCGGAYPCDDSLFPDTATDCCSEWKATQAISAGAFDVSDGWVPEDPNASKYHLILADWSQPEAWITGEPAATIATRNLSNIGVPAGDDPFVKYVGSGNGYGIEQIPTPAESFMVKRTNALSQQNLMMSPQSKRTFMATTASDLYHGNRGTRGRGWGNTSSNILYIPTYNTAPDCCTTNAFGKYVGITPCNKYAKSVPRGGDAPYDGEYGVDTQSNVSTVSADDKDFYYFEIVALESAIGEPVLYGECDKCVDTLTCHGPPNGATACSMGGSDYPFEEGAIRRKIVVQHWRRSGSTITYEGNLDYPDCSGNWKGQRCLYGRNARDNSFNPRSIESCDPMDCNPPSASSLPWNSDKDQFEQYNGCNAVRPADIIYTFDGLGSRFQKVKSKRTWLGDSEQAGGNCGCMRSAKFGVIQYESLPQVFAIAPRVPMRSLSMRTRQWGSMDSYIESDSNSDIPIKLPNNCIMSNHTCSGPYKCKKVGDNWISLCERGVPKRAGCSPDSSVLPGRMKWDIICNPAVNHGSEETDDGCWADYNTKLIMHCVTGKETVDGSEVLKYENVNGCKNCPEITITLNDEDPVTYNENTCDECCNGVEPEVDDENCVPTCRYRNYPQGGIILTNSNLQLWKWVESCTDDGFRIYPYNSPVFHEECEKRKSENEPLHHMEWWNGAFYKKPWDPDALEEFYHGEAPPVVHTTGGVEVEIEGERLDYPRQFGWLENDGWTHSPLGRWNNPDGDKTYADLCSRYESLKSMIGSYNKAKYDAGDFTVIDGFDGQGDVNQGTFGQDWDTNLEQRDTILSCGMPPGNSIGFAINPEVPAGAWGTILTHTPDTAADSPLKWLCKHCCYCCDSNGGVAEMTKLALSYFGGHGWFCNDFGYPGGEAKCSLNLLNTNCKKKDNLTNYYNVYSDLLVGYPNTGEFTSGKFSSYHYNNKNLYYGLKSPTKLWSKNFEYSARPYVLGNEWADFRPKLGVTIYCYDAGQEGIDSYGADDITDMIAHTVIEPKRVDIDYNDKIINTPVDWTQVSHSQNIWGKSTMTSYGMWLGAQQFKDWQARPWPQMEGGAIAICVDGTIRTRCGHAEPVSITTDEPSECAQILNADCLPGARSNTYGDPQTFFQKYELWNKLYITEPITRAIYALEEYNCNLQYNEGDIVEYEGCQWVAQQQTFNPTGTWVGEEEYQHSERYNCAKQYKKGDLVRTESGNNTLIWEANENTKDPLTECPACNEDSVPPEICPYDCDSTYDEGDQAIFSGNNHPVQYIWTANTGVDLNNCKTYPEYDCEQRYSKGDKVKYDDKYYAYCIGDTSIEDCCSPCVEGTFEDIFNCSGSFTVGDKIKYDCRTYEVTKDWGPYYPYNCSGSYASGDVVTYNGNIYAHNGNGGCHGVDSIPQWSSGGPAEGGVGSNNAYPVGAIVYLDGGECDTCLDNASPCWQAETLDESALPREFIEDYFYPTSGLTTYWKECSSNECCEFDSSTWALSGSCLTTPEEWVTETGVCCPFDSSVWTETGICCEFDFDKWDQGDRAYCCSFETGEWTVVATGTECNEGCCPFDQIESFNCYGDYVIGEQVTTTGSDGVISYWTANVNIYNTDCSVASGFANDNCCPFDETQWDRGDSRSPYWKEGELGCAPGMAIEEHWYNAYYHRDAETSESSATSYNPSQTYSKGDIIQYPNPKSGGYGHEHVYTNISYKNPSPASADLNSSDDFNHDHWILGTEATTTSKAQQFEWKDFPANYPYSKYTRRIFKNKLLLEAYPFYVRDGGCPPAFDPTTAYGSEDFPPTISPLVVCDEEGFGPDRTNSEDSFGALKLWMLNVDPGITWKENLTKTVPTCEGHVVGTRVGFWTIDRGKSNTWYHGPGEFDKDKWRVVGTDEDTVRCGIDNELWHEDPRPYVWEDTLTDCAKYDVNTMTKPCRDGCQCRPHRNKNYGYCELGASQEVAVWDPVTWEEGKAEYPIAFNEDQTWERCNWRPVHQPEYFNSKNKIDFSGLYSSLISDVPLMQTDKAAVPPPTYNGGLWPQKHHLDIDINQKTSLSSPSNHSLTNSTLDMTSMCPATHVVKRSENGQGLQAVIWWDAHYRWDQYDRAINGQRQEYTYLELIEGGCEEDGPSDDYVTYPSDIYGDVHVSSWRLRWFDGKNEILSAASPPSRYVMNDYTNRNMGTCQPSKPAETKGGLPQGNRFSPCWDHVTQDGDAKHYSWLPWVEWSSDDWLFVYNFPLTTKDFENSDIELSKYAALNDLGEADGIPWPNTKPQDMELLYPSYIPPAEEVYNPNKIDGYPHVIVDASLNSDSPCSDQHGKVVGGIYQDNTNMLPPSARVLHSDNESENPIHNRDNATIIESTREEFTAIAPSTGHAPTWSASRSYPYQIGSVVEHEGETGVYQAIRMDPNGREADAAVPGSTEGEHYWTHLSGYSESDRVIIAGPWTSGNWFQKDGDGYLWTDWMVSHGDGHANCGKLWIPIGCRALDESTGKEHMRATTYFGNNLKASSVDGLTHGNRRYDAVGRTVGVPLTPPIRDHSQSDDV